MILQPIKIVLLIVFFTISYSILIFDVPDSRDTANPPYLDSCSERISLPRNFTFFNETYDGLWLCMNGILAFTFADTRYIPDPFPIEGNALIAPFWSDVDLRGLVNDTEAQQITWRVDTSPISMNKIDEILEDTIDMRNFEALWAFVATWNKVGYFFQETDLLNTFQVVLTCNDKTTKKCFCLIAYEDIQWTTTVDQQVHAQAGFNDGKGQYENIPGSRTANIRNLPMWSNVGVDGLFIYQLTAGGVTSKCRKQITPYYANMFFEKQAFRLSNFLCGRTNQFRETEEVEVLFLGKSFNITVNGTITADRLSVEGRIPFWGKGEIVRVAILTNGEFEKNEAMSMHFVPGTQWISNTVELENEVTEDNGNQIEVDLTWDQNHFNDSLVYQGKIMLKVFVVQFPLNGARGPFTFEVKHTQAVENNGRALISIPAHEGATFLQLDGVVYPPPQCNGDGLSFGSCTLDPLTTERPVFTSTDGSNLECSAWVTNEQNVRDLNGASGETWDTTVGNTFGCPRNSLNRGGVSDATFAELEVTRGLVGWQYDPCCGGTTSEFGYYKLCTGGRSSGCPLNKNEQIDFCIQSPTIVLREKDVNNAIVQIPSSNQCCYTTAGDLITSADNKAGSTRKSSINGNNFLEFYLSEIPALKKCDDANQRTDNKYYAVRPISVGEYSGRMIIWIRGDPHIGTLDGFEYTYNGLGVYVLTKTKQGHPTNLTMQTTTRRAGNGTVFSGCFIRDSSASLEFYLNSSNEITVKIDGNEIDTQQFMNLETDEVHYSRNNVSTEFTFKMIESDFIVKAFIGDAGVVNFAVSPPFELEGALEGLLGNFDGVKENDLITKDGIVVPINSSLELIHSEFGDTWEVGEEDWLFSENTASFIKQDIALGLPFTAIYTPQFQSEELKRQAEEICGDDATCLLDVSLTGKIEFATNSVALRDLIETVQILNEVALEAHNGEAHKEGEEIEEEDQILSALRSKGITVLTGVLIGLIVLIVVVIGTFYAACSVKHPKMNRNKVEPENLLGMTKHII